MIVKDAGRREEVRGQYNGHGSILGARAGIKRCFRCGKGTTSGHTLEVRGGPKSQPDWLAVGEASEDTVGNLIKRVGQY